VIHRLVESLDRFYGNVCELDLIFSFEDAYAVVDEMIGGHGAVMEMGIRTIVNNIEEQKS
jgi:AP-1 complex subunit sigma 1/2